MNFLGRVIGNFKGLYSGINGATLTGAIDVIIIEQEDGTFRCSPFHVRFGKLGVLRSREKVVDIELNGVSAPIRMKLGDSGEAFFVQAAYDFDSDDENLATSPLPASPQLSDCDSSLLNIHGREEALNKNRMDVSTSGDDNGILIKVGDGSPPKDIVGSKGNDDSKSRKRRKKRKRNQGSKGNIIVDPTYEPTEMTEGHEAIFKMDEELKEITQGLQSLDISSANTQANNNNSLTTSMSRSFKTRDFFSDTEVDVTTTRSRESDPIQSDSEYEINKIPKQTEGNEDDLDGGKWRWGEMPISTGTPATTPMGPQPSCLFNNNNNKSSTDENPLSSDEEGLQAAGRVENKSVLGSMFSFMTKRHASGSGNDSASGIYLDDLNLENMDPEVAALYFPNYGVEQLKDFPRREHDEDGESGHGSSLTQSPAPGSSPSHVSIFINEHRQSQDEHMHAVLSAPKFEAISICGSNLALFEQSQLTFDELVENPDLILNTPPEAIVVKINGQYVPWTAALPQLLSTTFFRRPLPTQLHDISTDQKKEDNGAAGQSDLPSISRSNSSSSKDPNAKGKGYSWFPWGRRSTASDEEETQMISNSPPSDTPLTTNNENNASTDKTPIKVENNNIVDEDEATTPVVEKVIITPVEHLPVTLAETTTCTSNPVVKESSSSSDESEGGGGEDGIKINRASRGSSVQPSPHKPIPPPLSPLNIQTDINVDHPEKYIKSLRLTSDQIAALDLRYGQNECVFSVTTAYQGTSVARCHIYLWRYNDRVVISDIDGTITKSDVLGHILPIIGTAWAQSGVAQLFTQIQDNGYKLLYLSARAIGQATSTREYLRSIKQDDVTLPDGPLLLSPTSLMSAFHREVIEKKPEEFKIACLRDIQALFPTNPFYAGYGNKINDVWAYRAVDIAIPRIFTINHKGELRHALTNTFQSSYTSLGELAEFIFPPYKLMQKREEEEDKPTFSFSTTDGYSSFEFWREPVPELLGLEADPLTTVVTGST